MDFAPTKLEYYDDMYKLHSISIILSYFQGDDGRRALILSSTIFHPQGGGQPSDTGYMIISDLNIKFVVQDVRSKDGIVFHYGYIEKFDGESEPELVEGKEVLLYIEPLRRNLNSRLHSAGHLLDSCLKNVGLAYFEPGKGYHFPDGYDLNYLGSASFLSWRVYFLIETKKPNYLGTKPL